MLTTKYEHIYIRDKMKKSTLVFASLLTSFTSIAQAAYSTGAVYIGAKAGASMYQKTESDLERSQGFSVDSSKLTKPGAGAFLGYQMSRYFAVELGFDWLGKAKYTTESNGDITMQDYGVQFGVKGNLPFFVDNLDIYGRIGIMATSSAVKFDAANYSDTHYGASPVYAIGFDYSFTDNLSMRLEYQYIQKIKNNLLGIDDVSNGLGAVGMIYSFGSESRSSKAASANVENNSNKNANNVEMTAIEVTTYSEDGTSSTETITSPNINSAPVDETIELTKTTYNSNDESIYDVFYSSNGGSNDDSSYEVVFVMDDTTVYQNMQSSEMPTDDTLVYEVYEWRLSSDVLFPFNNAELTEQGKDNIKFLLEKYKKDNKADNGRLGKIKIVGYTDTIGSPRYNLQLSKKRADAIRRYLISLGVDRDGVVAHGAGESKNITGTKCNKLKTLKALKACLAPERRAEFSIDGESVQQIKP